MWRDKPDRCNEEIASEGRKWGWPPLIRMDQNVRKKIDTLLGGKL
jgi:hypothetical protein